MDCVQLFYSIYLKVTAIALRQWHLKAEKNVIMMRTIGPKSTGAADPIVVRHPPPFKYTEKLSDFVGLIVSTCKKPANS